jgi:hypothetical protein
MKNTYPLFVLLVIAGTLSCNKNNSGNNNPSQKTCRIQTIKSKTRNITQTINFTYDEAKRPVQILYSDGFSSKKNIITYPTAGPYRLETFIGSDPLWFGRRDCSQYGDGTLQHLIYVYNAPGALPGTADYVHDGHGYLVTKIDRSPPPSTTQITTYKWDNFGNLIYIYGVDTISLQPNSDSLKYTYYLDKTYDPPNVDRLSKYMINADGMYEIINSGSPMYICRNLLKTLQSGNGSKWTFTYEFDAEGKVIKTIALSDTGVTTEITYDYIYD